MTQSKKYYQAYDERYRQVHEQSLQWSSQSPSPIVREILEKYHISKNDSILEIGCGEGRPLMFQPKQSVIAVNNIQSMRTLSESWTV